MAQEAALGVGRGLADTRPESAEPGWRSERLAVGFLRAAHDEQALADLEELGERLGRGVARGASRELERVLARASADASRSLAPIARKLVIAASALGLAALLLTRR